MIAPETHMDRAIGINSSSHHPIRACHFISVCFLEAHGNIEAPANLGVHGNREYMEIGSS